MPSIELRMATPEDAASIATVLYDSFTAYEYLYTPEAFAATVPAPEQIEARLSEGPVWIAVQNNTVVGTVSAVSQAEGLHIRSMAVLPAARRQGIGLLLLQVVETFAFTLRYTELVLSTTPFLIDAIRLYKLFGFEKNDEPLHELFETPLFTMVKQLEYSDPRTATGP